MRSQGAVARATPAFAGCAAVAAFAATFVACGGSHGHGGPVGGPVGSTSSAATTTSSSPTQPTVPPPTPAPATLTRYPVVLIHGMAGFARLGSVDYFNRVPDRLRSIGCEVLVTASSPINTSALRATQIRDQILAAYPDPQVKLNLIGHSQGGMDARYLISSLGLGDRVASLTTIGTPHRGSPVADMALGLIPGNAQVAIDVLLNQLTLDWGQIVDLSTVQARTVFNPQNPDDPRVYYQSFAGVADFPGSPGHAKLQPALFASYPIVAVFEGENDGLVSIGSAQWGNFRGTIPCDHALEIGWFAPQAGFSHLSFYEELVLDLARRGF